MSPPSQNPLPSPFPPHPSACRRVPVCIPCSLSPSSESYSKFPLAICFIHGVVNFCYSVHTPPFLPLLLLPCPQVYSLYLFLHCYPENKFISAISSDSIYMCQYTIFIGEGNGNPLQYSCLANPMDGGAWQAEVHGVTRSWTRLSDFIFTFHFHALEKSLATHSSVLAWRIPGTGEPGGLPSLGQHRVGHD